MAAQGISRELVVLVVEDDELQRSAYQLQLKSLGLPLRVITSNNAFTALVQIGRSQPDVVISDLVMEGVNGFQMIRALKSCPQIHCPKIIAVTSLTAAERAEYGDLPSDVSVFQKPVPFEILGRLLREMLVIRGE